jgi:hypothetical protein
VINDVEKLLGLLDDYVESIVSEKCKCGDCADALRRLKSRAELKAALEDALLAPCECGHVTVRHETGPTGAYGVCLVPDCECPWFKGKP